MDDQEEDEVWWFLVSELPCFASQVTLVVFGDALDCMLIVAAQSRNS